MSGFMGESDDRYCGECGATLQEGVKFCGQCGAAVPGTPQSERTAESQNAAETPSLDPRSEVKPYWNRRSRGPWVLLAILLAALLALGYLKFIRQPSTASTIESIISSNGTAVGPTCAKIGLINYVGARSDLYDCTGDYGAWDHCYVYTGGGAYDVTTNVKAVVRLEKLAGTYNAATGTFPCAG